MRKADLVQMAVCLLDLPVDPGRWPILRSLRAEGNNAAKIAVGGYPKPFLADRLGQRMRHVKTMKRHDSSPLGLDPVNLLRMPVIGHGKYADGIGLQKDQRIDRHQ